MQSTENSLVTLMPANRENFLKERRNFYGGSDIAAMFGLGMKSPIRLWQEKMGLVEANPETEITRKGLYLEPFLATLYEERTGDQVIGADSGQMLVAANPRWPRIMGHPDGLVLGQPRGVEFKDVNSPRQLSRWGNEDDLIVPEEYMIQSQVYMGLLNEDGITHWDLFPFLGHMGTRLYRIPFDPDIWEAITTMVDRFQRDFIETQTPPPPDGSDAWAEELKRQFPKNLFPHRPPTEEEYGLVQQFLDLSAAIDAEKERLETLKQDIALRIGSADGLICADWRVDYKERTRKGSIDMESLRRDYEIPADVLDRHRKPSTIYRHFEIYGNKR